MWHMDCRIIHGKQKTLRCEGLFKWWCSVQAALSCWCWQLFSAQGSWVNAPYAAELLHQTDLCLSSIFSPIQRKEGGQFLDATPAAGERSVWECKNQICMNNTGAGRWHGETPSDTAEIPPEITTPTLNPHLCCSPTLLTRFCSSPHWTPAAKVCWPNTDVHLSTWEAEEWRFG